MDIIRQYLLSILSAGLVCSVIMGMTEGKGTTATLAKLMAGLFLTLTVLHPISEIRFGDISDLTGPYTNAAHEAAERGSLLAQETMAQSIKTKTEAYILDKAKALNTLLEVEVTLTGDDVPCPKTVRLVGNISPYAKAQLQKIIAEDIGIAKENQLWI